MPFEQNPTNLDYVNFFEGTPYPQLGKVAPFMKQHHRSQLVKLIPQLTLTKNTRARYIDPLEKAKVDEFVAKVEKDFEVYTKKKLVNLNRYIRRFK